MGLRWLTSSGGTTHWAGALLVLATLVACAGTTSPGASTSSPSSSASASASSSASSSSASPSATTSSSASSTSTSSSTSASATPIALTGFGTAPVSGGHSLTGPDQSHLVRVVAASHEGFDRLVLDFGSNPVPHFTVTPQQTSTFPRDPSDLKVTLEGDAGVRVTVHDTVLTSTAVIGHLVPRYPAIREVREIGNFEAVVSYGVGVRGPVRIRVTTLSGLHLLVVDVAWR